MVTPASFVRAKQEEMVDEEEQEEEEEEEEGEGEGKYIHARIHVNCEERKAEECDEPAHN